MIIQIICVLIFSELLQKFSLALNRVGLVGNPSDGFYGKTISLSISNFWAEVTMEESELLRLKPHPLNDPMDFGSLSDLHGISLKEGYLGGLRLLQATCKKFYQYCSQKGLVYCKFKVLLITTVLLNVF